MSWRMHNLLSVSPTDGRLRAGHEMLVANCGRLNNLFKRPDQVVVLLLYD